MKALVTTDNIGGVWTFTLELTKGLKKHGVEVILAVIGEPLTSEQKAELSGISYRHFKAKQEWMEDPWEDVYASGKWLMWLTELENPDVVHLNSYTLGCLEWNIPVVVTLHSCVLSWWEAVKNEQAPASWNKYREHVKAGMQSADIVTAPSKSMLCAAENYYGPFRNKKVIYNGRNHKLFNRSNKQKLVFSMGRLWDEAKNINLLVEAAVKLNYPLYIAGEMHPYESIMLTSNVHFLGRLNQQQVSEWLAKAWIYALPAKYEPFGYSFLEAALSGCVLVGGKISSLKEIWNDNMLYADTDGAEELAILLNELFSDDEKLNVYAEKAYENAIVNYSAESMTKNYFNIYQTVNNLKTKTITH